MLGTRTVSNSRLNISQIKEKAINFLHRNGYDGMEQVAQEKFGNISTVACVPNRNGDLRIRN